MNPHKNHPATPMAMFSSLWRNRQLIWQMTRRDIVTRYRGSLFGLVWSFINPILLLLVYTFVFSEIFQSRWIADGSESKTDFAIIIFAGMVVFNLFSELVNSSPGLVIANVNYVKRVIFPLEILPWVTLGSALFHALISLFVLLMVQLVINLSVPWTIIFFPLTLLPLVFASVGFSWFLAALGVFVRDIGQVTSIFTMMLFFLSAIFYPVSAIPEQHRYLFQLNPLVPIIAESRNSLVFGQPPNWVTLGISLLISLLIAFAGFWWFQKVRKGFADVI
jgi:lipopolysaccharide transport system permease protein